MDAEILDSLCREPAVSKVVSLKPGVGQNIALLVSPAGSHSACRISPLLFIQFDFFLSVSFRHKLTYGMNSESDIYLWFDDVWFGDAWFGNVWFDDVWFNDDVWFDDV